jgi:hypothetical protein
MPRSIWRSTIGAAVMVPALLVVLLAAPLPVAAAPEGGACVDGVRVLDADRGDPFLVGPAVDNHGLNVIPGFAYSAPYEDLRLKKKQ